MPMAWSAQSHSQLPWWAAETALWLLFTWNHIVFCCLFLAHFMAPVFQVNGTILVAKFLRTHPPPPPAPRRCCAVTFQTLSARQRSFVFFWGYCHWHIFTVTFYWAFISQAEWPEAEVRRGTSWWVLGHHFRECPSVWNSPTKARAM